MATHLATIESITQSKPPQLRNRSQASSMAWIAVASDSEFCWRSGILLSANEQPADDPFCLSYGFAFGTAEPASWVRDAALALDREFPPVHVAEAALSTRDFVAPLDPAISRIPERAEEYSAAICIFGSRLILSCRHLIVPPAFVKAEVAIARLQDASLLAISVGGQGAVMEAIRLASRRRTYENPSEPELVLEFGEDEQ
jgi:hypothetical protein